MKKVSVIMSTYKEPLEWVSKCIESVVNQTIKPYEYIIIIDCPQNSELIGLLNEYANKYQFIKILVNDVNSGLVKSLNKALENCNGDYIARIDADDYAELNRFELQLAYMDEMKYDIVGAGYNVFYDDLVLEERYGKTNDKLCKKILKYSTCIAHPTWMVKSEVYKDLNGYRNIDSCEDLDFLIRAASKGFKMGCVKKPLVWYRNNPSSISHNNNYKQKAIRQFLCNNYRKHKEVSWEFYNAYIHSKKFSRIVKSIELVQTLKNQNNSNRKISTIIRYIQLCFNDQYIKQAICNQKMKIITKLYA